MRSTDARPRRAQGVGGDLRAFRKARKMTLAELALGVGRSIGWLSQVERGLTEPTFEDLRLLAKVLNQPVSFFFGAPDGPMEERGFVVRAGRRRLLGSISGGHIEELLSPDLTGGFEMLRSTHLPGAESDGPLTRPTEEAGYVASGTFELTIGANTYILGPGDSFRFAREPISWRNPGIEPCVVIWVIAPPVF